MLNRRMFMQTGLLASLSPFSILAQNSKDAIIKDFTITEPNKKINIVDDFDVIVCGGGPAGFAAAVSAGRNGANVLLIELQGCLGGIWTTGLMTYFIDHENKEGLMRELLEIQINDGVMHRNLDVELTKLWLEKICVNAGVNLLYHTRIVGALNKRNRINVVITENGSGRQAWRAKVFIDCTGNGDLALHAGCGYDFGHPETGSTQPLSLCALLTGLNVKELQEGSFIQNLPQTEPARPKLLAEIRKGGADCSYGNPTLWAIKEGLFSLMSNHEYKAKSNNAIELTHATISARQEINSQITALKSLGGIWKNIQLVATADHIGMREGRRIHGRYMITLDDLKRGAQFEDAVCRVTSKVNHHSLDSSKTLIGESYHFQTEPWDIPLRALIAKDVDGLMMAGRCISGDFWAHGSYRMTGNAVAMGEAAGLVAAHAALNNKLPHQVNYKEISK